jgi:hypothetical protein
MLMFDRKIQKNCGSVRVTTREFVLSVSKSIDSCKLKVDPEWGQRNWTIIGHRIRPVIKFYNCKKKYVVTYDLRILKVEVTMVLQV